MVAERLVVEKKKRRGSCASGALCDGGRRTRRTRRRLLRQRRPVASLQGSTQGGNTGRTRSLKSQTPMIQIQIQIRPWKRVATLRSTALAKGLTLSKIPLTAPVKQNHRARPHSGLATRVITLTRTPQRPRQIRPPPSTPEFSSKSRITRIGRLA